VPRQNLCPNPAAGANNTGYGGGSTPTRVTGLSGFPVTTGVQYTSGTFQVTPLGVVAPGQVVTASVYARAVSLDIGNTLYLYFDRSAGADVTTANAAFSLSAGVVTRLSVTGTAPALAVGAYLVMDGTNAGVAAIDVTACLYEVAGALDTYFDGGSPGATWDGAEHNSTSTLADTEVTGTAAAVLGGLTAAAVGTVTTLGTAVASLGGLTGTALGSAFAVGTAAANLGGLTATAVGGGFPIIAGSTATVGARRTSTPTIAGG